jgi:hypothetical protein
LEKKIQAVDSRRWNPTVYGDDKVGFWILESKPWIPRLESKVYGDDDGVIWILEYRPWIPRLESKSLWG